MHTAETVIVSFALTALTSAFHSANLDVRRRTVDEHGSVYREKIRLLESIVEDYFSNDIQTIVVAGELTDELSRTFHESITAQMVFIGNDRSNIGDPYSAALHDYKLYEEQRYYRFHRGTRGFLLVVSSLDHLRALADTLANSRWWNAFAYFAITPASTRDDECSAAYEFLNITWAYNALSSVFICQDANERFTLYAFNPFSDSAPKPWLKTAEYKGIDGHPWTLFRWENYSARGNRNSREVIFFDKTKSLNGYPIRTSAFVVPPFVTRREKANGSYTYEGENGITMRVIFERLNATMIDTTHSTHEYYGWIDENGTFTGNLVDLSTNSVDVAINGVIMNAMWKLKTMYPHSMIHLCFVTKDRGIISWLFGLMMVFDRSVVILWCTVFVIAAVFFGYGYPGYHRSYISGIMAALNICLSSSVHRLPDSTRGKVVVMFVLLLPLVFNGTIQAKLVSLIEHPLHFANFNLWSELTSLRSVQGPTTLYKFITNTEIRKLFVGNNLTNCLENLANGESVACISYCSTLSIISTSAENLHVGRDGTLSYLSQYVARPDWPLAPRFDEILQRLFEANLSYMHRIWSMDSIMRPRITLNSQSARKVGIITLDLFRYVFLCLAVGWLFATCIFIGELLWNRIRRTNKCRMPLPRSWWQRRYRFLNRRDPTTSPSIFPTSTAT